MRAGTLKKGGFIQIKGRPCKILDYSTSKTGKHGHAKMSVTAVDVLTGRKLEDAFPTSHNVDVPEVKRDEYMVVAVDEPFVSLMLEDGTMKENVMLPENEDLKNKIMEGLSTGTSDVFVQVLSAPIGEDGSTAVLEEMVVDVRIVAAKN